MLALYLSAIDSQQDREKFEIIYTRYRKRMYHEALKIIRDPDWAEDVVHDAFLTIIKKIEDIRMEEYNQLTAFIVLLTRNKAIDQIRKIGRETAIPDETLLEQYDRPVEDTDELVVSAEALAGLVDMLSTMDEKYRIPLTMQANGSMVKEIASVMGISTEAVKARLFRARKMAKLLLEKGEMNAGN